MIPWIALSYKFLSKLLFWSKNYVVGVDKLLLWNIMIFNDNLTRKFYHQNYRIVLFLDVVMTFMRPMAIFTMRIVYEITFFVIILQKNLVIWSVSRSHSDDCSRHFSTCSDLSILQSKFSDPICSHFNSDNLFCFAQFHSISEIFFAICQKGINFLTLWSCKNNILNIFIHIWT